MRKGQMLIELMVALSVVMMTLVALVQVSTKSLSNAGFSQKQAQAANLAIREIETIRTIKNQGWDNFFYVYAVNSSNVAISGTEFNKTITYTKSSGNDTTVDVSVVVSWMEKGRIFSSKQNTTFSKY